MKGDKTPTIQEMGVLRPKDQLMLFDRHRVNDTVARYSESVDCSAFKEFGLYLFLDSTLAPTTLQVEVQFGNRHDGQWYTYKQGPFAALFYEDGDTGSGVYECFSGPVIGRDMRIKLTGVGTTAAAFFDVSASVDFNN